MLIPIGEFSRRCRLSVRMLRYYDEHGVLVPASVDAQTGYRRYDVAQLTEASAVRRLRDVGFATSAMCSVLAARGTSAYDLALRARRAELADELRTVADRLTLIDHLINDSTTSGEAMTAITVSTATIPAMRVVTLRGVVPTYSDESLLWERAMPELAAQGITPIGPCGVIEHDREYKESDVDLAIWVPVAPGVTAAAPLETLDLPAREVLQARVEGPYSLITEANMQIDAYAREHGLVFAQADSTAVADLGFNVYLTDPSTAASPDDLVTLVCWPLA